MTNPPFAFTEVFHEIQTYSTPITTKHEIWLLLVLIGSY
jgi:hypothetical protein